MPNGAEHEQTAGSVQQQQQQQQMLLQYDAEIGKQPLGHSGQPGTDSEEGGLALEQPDGEGSAPLVTPEVVRGRVARSTEMLQRQRIQQEASQQVPSVITCVCNVH